MHQRPITFYREGMGNPLDLFVQREWGQIFFSWSKIRGRFFGWSKKGTSFLTGSKGGPEFLKVQEGGGFPIAS